MAHEKLDLPPLSQAVQLRTEQMEMELGTLEDMIIKLKQKHALEHMQAEMKQGHNQELEDVTELLSDGQELLQKQNEELSALNTRITQTQKEEQDDIEARRDYVIQLKNIAKLEGMTTRLKNAGADFIAEKTRAEMEAAKREVRENTEREEWKRKLRELQKALDDAMRHSADEASYLNAKVEEVGGIDLEEYTRMMMLTFTYQLSRQIIWQFQKTDIPSSRY